MAETALGVLGLAGPFSTCLDVFELVQLARSRSWESELLQQKLENEFYKFGLWGRSVNIIDPDLSIFQHSSIQMRRLVTGNMRQIFGLFAKFQTLTDRYGLALDDGRVASPSPFQDIATQTRLLVRRLRGQPNTALATGQRPHLEQTTDLRRTMR